MASMPADKRREIIDMYRQRQEFNKLLRQFRPGRVPNIAPARRQVPELFNLFVVLPEFRGCRDVHGMLLRGARKYPVAPYETLIPDYSAIPDEFKPRFEEEVNERFTAEEADLVESYFRTQYGLQTLRTPGICNAPYWTATGNLNRMCYLTEDLPFPLAVYYDLR